MGDDPRMQYLPRVERVAIRSVLGSFRAARPRAAALALVPEAGISGVATLQGAAREAGVPLIGAVFPRLIHEMRFKGEGAWLLRFDEERPCGIVDDLAGSAEDAAHRIVAASSGALDARPAGATLLLVVDAALPNIASILDALYLELGTSVRYLGVNAGSETFAPMPCLFDEQRLVGGGALWALLPAEQPAVLLHDYTRAGECAIATSASGNRIVSVDFRPAFDFYRDKVRERAGVELTRENFYRYAVELPFAIQLANGQLVVRMPVALEDDGSIRCAGEVPEHALLVVVEAPNATTGETGRMLAARLAERGVKAEQAFFYCAGRRMRLGDASEEDLGNILRATGARAGGALSLGEIGSFDGGAYPLLHNGALVCAEWAGG